MKDWARETNAFHHNLMVLGDFNLDRENDPNGQAFRSNRPAPTRPARRPDAHDLREARRPRQTKYFDQIAWFAGDRKADLTTPLLAAGRFDFMEVALPYPGDVTA